MSVSVIFILGLIHVIKSQNNCPGTINESPLVDDQPSLVRNVENGKLFTVDGNGIIDPPLYVAHVYGSSYDMGVAYGKLMSNEIAKQLNDFWDYLDESIEQYIWFLPKDIQEKIAVDGSDYALQYVYDLAEPFIPQRYIDMMQGTADGSGVSYTNISRLTMVPELIKAGCSMVGAWNTAVRDDKGSLIQLRALDWSTDTPLQQYPLVTVFHPNNGNGNDHATVGWIGFLGAITGMNSRVGICEKVWLHYDMHDSRLGEPFNMVLQDIIWFDNNKQDAIKRMNNDRRTCSIFVGVGDIHSETMDVCEYSYHNVTCFNSTSYPVYNGHPYIKDTIYVNKHSQPSSDPCLADILQNGYGNITSEFLWRNAAGISQTGDQHLAVYDYDNGYMYVGNSQIYVKGQPTQPAYDRPAVKLDMNQLFSLKL